MIAEVTFYGTDQAGNEVSATGLGQHQLRGFRRPVVMRTSTRSSLLALVTLSAACSVQETPIPMLSGPSELALRIAMQVTPDEILQDGTSQASLNIDVASVDGRPRAAWPCASTRLRGRHPGLRHALGEDRRHRRRRPRARRLHGAGAAGAAGRRFQCRHVRGHADWHRLPWRSPAYGAAPSAAAWHHPAAERGAAAGLHAHAFGADRLVERRL